eukprot:COSAG01_NODE_30132_length_622_cov_0.780115_1_plen_135_part_00
MKLVFFNGSRHWGVWRLPPVGGGALEASWVRAVGYHHTSSDDARWLAVCGARGGRKRQAYRYSAESGLYALGFGTAEAGKGVTAAAVVESRPRPSYRLRTACPAWEPPGVTASNCSGRRAPRTGIFGERKKKSC